MKNRWMVLASAAALTMGMAAWAHEGEQHRHGKQAGSQCESCCKKGHGHGKQGKQGKGRQAPAQAPEQTPQPEKK